ncbi:MAG: biotin synthase BioB [Desulfobacterales bacterium]
MPFQNFADLSIQGKRLNQEQCHRILGCHDDEVISLIDAAYRVRREYFGNRVHIHVLSNAKSGLCIEDCHYCSQSRVSNAKIRIYPLVSKEKLLAEARAAVKTRAHRFCMALSGKSPTEKEIQRLCDIIRSLKQETGLLLCASLGFLDPGQAARLKAAGLDRVNHNLNTSERFYNRICTTHSFRDRLATIANCQAAGLEICSGGIIGQGETDEDIIDLLAALRDIKPQAVPINFLIPVKGTPFENRATDLDPRRCLKALCLARFLNPKSEVRAAGGREYHLRSLQPLALYVVDSIFVAGYLTTEGQSAQEAFDMIADLGFEAAIEGADIDHFKAQA